MSVSGSSVAGDGAGGKTVMAEMAVVLSSSSSPQKDKRKIPPQKRVDEFWQKFTTKAPGKVTTVLPKDELAEKLAKRKSSKRGDAGEVGSGMTAQASYEEAAAMCKAKVDKIVQECRRVNQKYRDAHFDLEVDLKTGRRDCLESLSNLKSDSDFDFDSEDEYPGLRLGKSMGSRGGNIGRKRDKGEGGAAGSLPVGDDSPQGRTPGSRFCPRSVKRVGEIFDDPKFYIDGPTANDVRQGRDGDCWLMAALCTLSNKPGLIERICVAHNQDVGVYGFVFHRDGEWVSEIIDDKLYLTKPDYDEAVSGGVNMERILWEDRERPDSEEIYRKTYQSNSGALYFAQCENPNETWLPLLEKAYAKAHSDYAAIEGGYTGEGIEDLTGGVTSGLFTTDILDKEYFWKEELMKVNQQFLFGCSTGVWGRGWGERKGIMEGHAYSVMKAVEIDGERLVLLRNPWGKGEWTGPWSDGSKEWTPEWLQKLNHRFGDDGAFWISYKDLLRKYQAFDRTRLFGPDWKITSIWTTLSVPWTLEYHDTKFAFTLSRAGPVVLVLSQLDDRYFRGLEGQYKFGLGIRVHKAGEDDYLVRAQTAYRMTRSVNVELELEAGDYTVCVKLDAHRQDWIKPVEDVIRDNSKKRREKLMRIGLAYDLAHSKARIIETQEERAARRMYEKRKTAKERERLRKIITEERQKNHYLNVKHVKKQRKRIERRKQRRKAAEEKKKAKKAEAEKKAMEEKARAEQIEKSKKDGIGSKEAKAGEAEDAKNAGNNKTTDNKAESGGNLNQTPEPSQSSVGENTPTTSPSLRDVLMSQDTTAADDQGEQQSIHDKEDKEHSPETTTDNPGEEKTPKAPEPAPVEDKSAQNTDTQPAETAAEGAGASALKEEGKGDPELKSNAGEQKFKSVHAVLAEADEKLKRAIGIIVSLEEQLEAMVGGSKCVKEEPHEPHQQNYPGDGGSSSIPFYTPKTHASLAGGGPPHPPYAPPHPFPGYMIQPGHGQGPSIINGGGPSRPPPPPPPRSVVNQDDSDSDRDDLTSVTTLSDLSDRELDFHFRENQRQKRLAISEQQQRNQSRRETSAGQARVPLEDDDDFERDPWNAVAVVGLRVYYKVMEGDGDGDGGQDIVKLRVIRPSLYDLSDEEKGDGDDEGDGKREEDDDNDKGQDGDGKGGEEAVEEEQDEAKVLDVDDSAKDATSQVVP